MVAARKPLGGHTHTRLSDDLFFDDQAMKYACQGKLFCAEGRRARNFTYANRVARDEWEQRIHFGEIAKDYKPEGEFYDALVRRRQSQYDVTVKGKEEEMS